MSARRAVAWVVRHPNGDYWSVVAGGGDWCVWQRTRERAVRHDLDGARTLARNLGEGAKVWRVVRGKAAPCCLAAERVLSMRCADLVRAEEAKAALAEQCRGLATKAADAEAQLALAVRRLTDIISIALAGEPGCP